MSRSCSRRKDRRVQLWRKSWIIRRITFVAVLSKIKRIWCSWGIYRSVRKSCRCWEYRRIRWCSRISYWCSRYLIWKRRSIRLSIIFRRECRIWRGTVIVSPTHRCITLVIRCRAGRLKLIGIMERVSSVKIAIKLL